MKLFIKIIPLFVLFALITGCVGKYFNREVDNGLRGSQKLFFAYGKFCGNGHPANIGKVDENGNVRTLLGMYPPMDDIDAMCYAHDYCFKLPDANKIVCDTTLQWMTAIYEYKFHSLGCWDVLSNISMAMAAKNYEKGDFIIETWANRITKTVAGIPMALIGTAIYSPLKLLASDAKEGECNVGASPNPVKIINRFEKIYRKSLYNIIKRHSITIPAPESALNKSDN